MIRRPPRSTQGVSSAASDVYKRQVLQNLHKARQSIIASGGRPEHEPWVVDCDSSLRYSNYMHNVSPCLTKSRARGHWLLHKNRRMNINEMLRLQGFNPAQVAVAVSECTLGQQIGNAMSVNVIERVLNHALQAAGLTRKSCLKKKSCPTRDRLSLIHI